MQASSGAACCSRPLSADLKALYFASGDQAVDSRGGLVLRGLQVALAVHVGARADVEMLSVAPTPLILTPPQVTAWGT